MDYHAFMHGDSPASKVMSIEGLIIHIASYVPTNSKKSIPNPDTVNNTSKNTNKVQATHSHSDRIWQLDNFCAVSKTFRACCRRDEIWIECLRNSKKYKTDLGSAYYSKKLIKSLSVKQLRLMGRLRSFHDLSYHERMMKCIEKGEMQTLSLKSFVSLTVVYAIQRSMAALPANSSVPKFTGFECTAFGSYASQALDSRRKLVSEEEMLSLRGWESWFKVQPTNSTESQNDVPFSYPLPTNASRDGLDPVFTPPYEPKTSAEQKKPESLHSFTTCHFSKDPKDGSKAFKMDNDDSANHHPGGLSWEWVGGGCVLYQKKRDSSDDDDKYGDDENDAGGTVYMKEVSNLEELTLHHSSSFLNGCERFCYLGCAVRVGPYPVLTISRTEDERGGGTWEMENVHVRMFAK